MGGVNYLAVFEAAIQPQQLAGVDHVSALPALVLPNPVEAIDQENRRWRIATVYIGHVKPQSLRQAHHEPFIDHGMGIVLIGVIWFQDICGWRASH